MCLVADWIVIFLGYVLGMLAIFEVARSLIRYHGPYQWIWVCLGGGGGGGGITYVQGEVQTDDIRPGKEVIEADVFCPVLQNWR